MLNVLRVDEGFTLAAFERATGLAGAAVQPQLEALVVQALVERSGAIWRPTALGFRFLNDLQAAFLPERSTATPAPARVPPLRASSRPAET